MMNYPLLITDFMFRAATYFPEKEIVSVYPGGTFTYNYGAWYRRVCQLAHALDSLKLKKGDRVASFALNNHRHFELYFGAPCTGRVLHTLNIRLSQEHLVYIINHAEDKVIFVDEDVCFLLEPVMDRLKTVKQYVILSQTGKMPQTKLSPAVLYDDLIAPFPEQYDFPMDLDENDPCLICYTSATTGDPKGVVYSHRGLVMHSYMVVATLGSQETDCVLLIVPMFHANAWGAPFVSPLMGLKVVLPGRQILDMKSICTIIKEQKVTYSYGVPTIWMMLHQYLEAGGEHDFSTVRLFASGGSGIPIHLMESFEKKYGVPMVQGYGSTECSPIVTMSLLKGSMAGLPVDDKIKIKATAGMPVAGLQVKIITPEGKVAAMNGEDMGEICVRGPWIASEYFRDPETSKRIFKDGWFHTGDIGTINSEGYITLVDRVKDMIKSAGEWISSVDLENTIMSHPKVQEAAVIGIPHEKWQERPCACVVPRPEHAAAITRDEIIDFLKTRVAKWWLPDEVVFIKEIPKTSVGKFSKKELRKIVFPMLNVKEFG
ncbi:MAG TPA: long-chain fatty acid--CoA ligase [Spirochaetota bacterium]|nr:long-chain fatty acid--CoA ligase [Spirochaetota bacterium]HOD16056.1 long-chain fatty acid--CoA ligase [Spirochaetota bacterium]HQL83605.1 long-chain fatty acid--CoA ligase [Spirochaetota bacterium]